MARKPRKATFTEFGLKKLKPEPKPYLVWDEKQGGLAIRIEPTGHKSWKCIYKIKGRKIDYTIGSVAKVGIANARKLAADILYQVAQGKDPQAEKRATRSTGTFDNLADQYLEVSKKRNKSWKQADRLVRKHLRPVWGKLPAENISRADVRSVMLKITAPIVANQTLASASAIFSWGIKQEIVKVNPCHGVDRNPTTSRDRVLSDTELPLFWKAFDAAGVQGAALKVLLLLGQRPGEVSCMRMEHITDGWWELPGGPVENLGWPGTKNAQSHRVWISAPAKAIIAGNACAVFPNARRNIDLTMRQICKALGVPRATPHDLRRTNGTLITGLGFGREAMNRIQNHKEGGIADVYDQHKYKEENKRIMEAVGAHIMGLVEDVAPRSNVVALR